MTEKFIKKLFDLDTTRSGYLRFIQIKDTLYSVSCNFKDDIIIGALEEVWT